MELLESNSLFTIRVNRNQIEQYIQQLPYVTVVNWNFNDKKGYPVYTHSHKSLSLNSISIEIKVTDNSKETINISIETFFKNFFKNSKDFPLVVKQEHFSIYNVTKPRGAQGYFLVEIITHKDTLVTKKKQGKESGCSECGNQMASLPYSWRVLSTKEGLVIEQTWGWLCSVCQNVLDEVNKIVIKKKDLHKFMSSLEEQNES